MKFNRIARQLSVLLLGAALAVTFSLPTRAQLGCPDRVPETPASPDSALQGVVNAYYPPNPAAGAPFIAGGILPAGSTSIPVTGITNSDSAITDIVVGDLLLVMQMQDADIDTSNNNNYGGTNGTGTGRTAINRTGRYEFVRVISSVAGISATGGTVGIIGAGAGNGTVNEYRQAAATLTTPVRRFQVIRVPQYTSVGIDNTNGLSGAIWDGTTGGVCSIDVQNVLSFTNTANTVGRIDVSGIGFRGGGALRLSGTTTGPPSTVDFRFTTPNTPDLTVPISSTAGADGVKGEGIAGTPRFVYNGSQVVSTGLAANVQGYVNGGSGTGSPGNGGGGGTDGNPNGTGTFNNSNSGGGGGSNCGAGGNGGNTSELVASTNLAIGGRGAASLAADISTTRLFMGGGGGAGSRDETQINQSNSSGGRGGGIVIVRAGIITGSGQIFANGQAGVNADADGGGGGGAGGSVLLVVKNPGSSSNSIEIRCNGGTGGNNSPAGAGAFGPGGGGGGGVIFTNFTPAIAADTNGGSNGTTTDNANNVVAWNAQPGSNGACTNINIPFGDPPGVPPGPDCITPTEARDVKFSATQYRNGQIGIKWATGYEVNNLGFRVWKEDRFGRRLVTPDIIAGNALTAGAALTAGNSYTWRDSASVPSKPTAKVTGVKGRVQVDETLDFTTSYWLEDVDMSGKSTFSGPFKVENDVNPMPSGFRNAPVLGQINSLKGAQTGTALVSPDPIELAKYLAEASTFRSAKAGTVRNQIANGAAVKLGVRTTGWQKVSRSALVTAGLNPNSIDANLQLFVGGREVPMQVTASGIEFFGSSIDTLQSGEQTYWLVEGNTAGLRIPVSNLANGSKIGVANFPYLVERQDRTTYFAALQNGDADNFFGSVVTNAAVDQALTVKNRDTNAGYPAQVSVTLQGVSLNPHRVMVKLNGQVIGEVAYTDRNQQTFTTTVAQSQILEGQNLVTLQSADSSDVNLVAAIRISYARTPNADSNALSLSGRGGQTMTVRGFSQAARVFDVTDANNPVEVAVRGDGDGNSGFSASFVVPGNAKTDHKLVAVSESRFLNPTVTTNNPSNLAAASNAANFVIITTPELAGSVAPLVQLRQSQGFTVKVVDVTDIYDEFNFGVKSAQAIKDFLNVASHDWQTPVRYVLFSGDASFDPRDYLGFGQDVIPTKLLGIGTLETASDDWFGDFDNSGLSQVAIGRLPGRTPTEIAGMVSKIVAFDQAGGQAWQREALIVADNNDTGGDFEAEATQVETDLPSSFTKTSVRIGQIGGPAARATILSNLNSGRGLVNYSGHGSVSNWAAESVLTADDVASLTNTDRPSLVVGMTCLNSFFDVYTPSLAKTLIRTPNRGAMAVWSSSALTITPGQRDLNKAFIRAFYGPNPAATLGDAIRQAKAAAKDPLVCPSFILLGDPTSRNR